MIIHGDCQTELAKLAANSLDSLVTDPPAGIAFMGKDWDKDKGGRVQWIAWMTDVMCEALRVLKPGAHGLVWALPRTSHWTATALENAGFEIRDVVTHLFGSGFPKSLNVAKSGAGDEWQGWGTALKPASEHWILVRKPLSEKTVAANVQKWGTGAINIDGCRIGYGEKENIDFNRIQDGNIYGGNGIYGKAEQKEVTPLFKPNGRFPANLVLDEEAAAMLDEQSGITKSNVRNGGPGGNRLYENKGIGNGTVGGFTDIGGASRFFYVAKASKSDRAQYNTHPTVKSTKLMAYLIKLVTPPGGIVLDPFMGSGSTGVAAKREGFEFLGIEQEQAYIAIAEQRISAS